ncbi:hydroxyquinol 1,2-dioxygenase [Amycolatopsis ultiminotia]|uniref:Hydroxyquinol 1,2-dioxygenase n=1 Tax=Amycolatopsis ultiminotia TaxID=543629 RepID=A0ABP6V2J5_9PSEU
MDFTEEQSADVAAASFDNTADPRLKEVMQSAVRHLHSFVREVRPSTGEWEKAIEFLTAIGQACTDTRQEFILFSDTMGVSMLVETINGAGGELPEGDAARPTAPTVLGPFHLTQSPEHELGDLLNTTGQGVPLVVEGRVTDPAGKAIPGARLDTWQADGKGYYDVQLEGGLPEGTGRGLFTADDEGYYWYRSVLPRYYPIPVDGPAGDLVLRAGREPYRPAHLHFIVEAEGYQPVTTHAFVSDCEYIERDVVFAVKSSLIRDFVVVDDEAEAERFGVSAPFRHVRFDVVLAPEEG